MKTDRESLKNIIKTNLNIDGVKKLAYVILCPIINLFKRAIIKYKAHDAELHYKDIIQSIKKSGRKRLNFAAYVIFDSTYGMDGTFQLMLHDNEHWNPTIVVIPDISRGQEYARKTYIKTRDFFINRYGKEYVLDGWNFDTDEYFDYSDQFDIVYYANPYDAMVHKFHKIEYASKKNVLPIYVSYGYEVGRYTTLGRLANPELNLTWKCFVDTTYTYTDYLKYQVIKGKNVVLAGYSKMDGLQKYQVSNNDRKKILISPHHTVSMKSLPLSNFMFYSDLILKLPEMFPELDFVFRPHPLLFTTLINNQLWTQQDTDNYIKMLKEKGVEYSTGGDYLGIFAECDAIVNDCGSFTVEWLYTGKPGCFVYNKDLREKHLTTLMNKAIARYTIARSEQDIVDFIRSIAEDNETHEYKMESWVEQNIALNYPSVSQFLLKQIDILNF